MFDRLARGIAAVGESVKKESGKDFMLDAKYGYIHSCPTNLGTGMRASVHVDLPGYTKEGLPALKQRCEELKVQPRGTRGESGGQTGKLGNNIDVKNSFNQLVSCLIFMYCVTRNHLRHLQQAPTGLLRGGVGPVHDRRRQHPGPGGHCSPEEARHQQVASEQADSR